MRTALGLLFLTAGAFAQTPPAVDTTAPASAAPASVPDTALYSVVAVQDLKLTEGTVPVGSSTGWWSPQRPEPYAVLDGPGEAFIAPPRDVPGVDDTGQGTIAIRIPERREVSGRLFVEGPDATLVALRFQVPREAFASDQLQRFLETERDHYRSLLNAGLPGAAWWRHCVADLERGDGANAPPANLADVGQRISGNGPSNMDDTFALFTGSRAVAENLQLDRMLPATPKDSGDLTRKTADIPGITVAAYDWTAAISGLSPALDPLASLIPADQHAVFFPTFQALIDVSDAADAQGTPVLQALADPTGEAASKSRYQRQLGLPMSDLARLLGPKLIDSVALTGGDPYLATGSDIALLFRAKDADALQTLMLARISAAAIETTHAMPDGRLEGGEKLDDVAITSFATPGRELSSYVCRLGDAIVVSNSETQLHRIIAVSQGRSPALAAAPEYVFFRSRYMLGAADESGLLVVSDATIRRWCGPRWRIGDSRRTRAAAALSEVQARLIDAELGDLGATGVVGAAGAAATGPGSVPLSGFGEVTLSPSGVGSSIYGTLAFMTPIAELDLDLVSDEEADLYSRWRDGYQQNWSGKFDPIAVRFDVGAGRLAADVTVRPLIVGTDYRDFVNLSRGAKIAPQACDPHDDALLQWVLAIDKHAPLLGEQASMLSMMLPNIDALGWLGQAFSIYVDDDPFWDELSQAEDSNDFMEHNWPRLPIALDAEVGNGLLLTAFLVGVRGMIEQSSPDMTIWENHSYHDEPYVSIRPSPRAVEDTRGMMGDDGDAIDKAALYYAASGDGLIVSLNQSVIERAIDRRLKRKAQRAAEASASGANAATAAVPGTSATPTTPTPDAPAAIAAQSSSPWLGEHLCVRVKAKALSILDEVFGSEFRSDPLRSESFANLPILNEWHRLYPGEDPVAVHERFWHRRLLCPGGGTYRWNDEWQTMESSVYGHPGDKRKGPTLPPALEKIVSGAAGLTFEADGLRARFELQQTP